MTFKYEEKELIEKLIKKNQAMENSKIYLIIIYIYNNKKYMKQEETTLN